MKFIYSGCLLIGLFVMPYLNAQSYFSTGNNPEPELLWEIGASAGAINCLTDIGGKNGTGGKFIKDINWNKTRFCGSLFASATWQSIIAARLEAAFAEVTGSDAELKNATDLARNRYLRNLQFKTTVIELSFISELHVLQMFYKERSPFLLSPYLAAGFGAFNYTPRAFINNVWVDLRPLHTEGEGFKEYPDRREYKTFSWCLPVGAGIKYDMAGLINFRLEFLYRFTGTDYLDDVSTRYADPSLFSKYLSPTAAALSLQLSDRSNELMTGMKNKENEIRGNPANRDAYFSCMLKISLALGRSNRK